MKMVYVILLLLSFLGVGGCRNNWMENRAKQHSQHIMEHLHDDTASVFFSPKYFPQETVKQILTRLRDHCNRSTRVGGYKQTFYTFTIGGPDQVTFTYEYIYNCGSFRFQLSYYIYWQSYELKSLYISDPAMSEKR